MSFFGDIVNDVSQLASNAWNGNEAAYADALALNADMAGQVPGVGAVLPDGNEVRNFVNHHTGNDPNQSAEQANSGHRIGTVVGGLAGNMLGGGVPSPGLAAMGMAVGSDVGGWIANQF